MKYFQIQHITRTPNTTTVSVAYTVEKSGALLEPQAAIDAMATLDTQELAIILRQVVDVTAERKFILLLGSIGLVTKCFRGRLNER